MNRTLLFNDDDNPWGQDNNPWGKGGNPLNDLQERFKKFFSARGSKGGSGNTFKSVGLLLIIFASVWLASGIFQISPDERGVVLRFGRWVHTDGPGLHYRLPYPFEEVIVQSITTVNRIDIGGRKSNRSSDPENASEEGCMLTGDSNLANVTFTVLWRIKDDGVEKYLFNARSPDVTVGAVAESIMREIIGQTPIAFAQTEGRGEVNAMAQKRLQSIMDLYKMGVEIVQVQLQNVEPPASVIDSFRDVERAQADQQREINQADAYARGVAAEARGKVGKTINEAQAKKSILVLTAQGLAQRFTDVFEQYRHAPDITAKRIYLETMEDILSRTTKILIGQKIGAGGTVSYLPLHEMLKENKEQ
ncbi:MAG: FtsH protease activity modulator HflK [Holosporales bacterium]|jgi:membrane protease subunit HflK|nr:FtsH protease activity modulator HflK [Holosporales bacterium]